MKYYILLFVTITIFSCSNQNKENKKIDKSNNDLMAIRKSDSTEVTNLVRDFFQAFDDRNIEKMEQMLAPNSVIIHHNGVATGKEEILNVIKETKNWYPRKRKLSEFEFDSDGKFAIVGVINEVTFYLPEEREVYEPYNETWIFKKETDKWYPTRVHYSKIVQEKHSEEVE